MVGRCACTRVTAQDMHWHQSVHIPLVSATDSPSTRVNQPAPFHHRLPDPAWLFLRSTGRLVWGGKKQLRQHTDLGLWSLRPRVCGLAPSLACCRGISTASGFSAANGIEEVGVRPGRGPVLN